RGENGQVPTSIRYASVPASPGAARRSRCGGAKKKRPIQKAPVTARVSAVSDGTGVGAQARVVFVLGPDDRQGEHQDQIDQYRKAAAEHGHDDEDRAHPFDGNARVRGEALTDAEEPFAFLDPAQTARTFGLSGAGGRIAVAGIDRTDLIEDRIDFLAAD